MKVGDWLVCKKDIRWCDKIIVTKGKAYKIVEVVGSSVYFIDNSGFKLFLFCDAFYTSEELSNIKKEQRKIKLDELDRLDKEKQLEEMPFFRRNIKKLLYICSNKK